ncbi:putative cytochrome P450 [Thozetella sp. PMI_491]|nr:putative cytochrome P450 [Thozetella sp. PMI_491]
MNFPLFPSFSGSLFLFGGGLVTYLFILGVYRLYFAPASQFPGPKLAALTFLYEGYYDVWLGGRYTWKIRELHAQYGPFVRINPIEIHCNDPDFFDVLYVTAAKRRTNKCSWTRASAFKTIDHDLHRARRNQLSPFFSKASVRALEPLILVKVHRMCARLKQISATGGPVNLTHVFVALTLDIISRVSFGVSYELLELDDFARQWYQDMRATGLHGHLVRQFPAVFRLLSFSPQIASRSKVAIIAATQRRQQELMETVTSVVARHGRHEKSPQAAATIFHSMLDAEVPPEEKTVKRLVDEAQVLTGAGTMTVAAALETIFYHLLNEEVHMRRLIEEVVGIMPNPHTVPSVAELEKLPFLNAVLCEGLRLAKSVTHRLARVSPDQPYTYHDLVIPRGVPVSMTAINTLENPDIFPDPDAFVPDRWLPLDAPEVRRRRKALVVFGGGTRMCLGMHLAWAELYLGVSVVVRSLGASMKLHKVEFERDIKITVDGFNALPSKDSKGLRVLIN